MNKKVRKKSISNKKKNSVKKTNVKRNTSKKNTNKAKNDNIKKIEKKSSKKNAEEESSLKSSIKKEDTSLSDSIKDNKQTVDEELAKKKIDEKKKASSKKSQAKKKVNSNVSKSKTVKTKSSVSDSIKDKKQTVDEELVKEKIDKKKEASSKKNKAKKNDKGESLVLEEKATKNSVSKKKVKETSNLEDNKDKVSSKDKETLESDVKELSKRKLRIKRINFIRYSIVCILGLVSLFCVYKLVGFGIDTVQNHFDSKALIEKVLYIPSVSENGEEQPNGFNIEEVVVDFNTLLSTNSDTVGWMIFNNQVINNPVVHTSNNSYYLSHNFNRRSSSYGTIFMDYRNKSFDDRNVVFFGHDNLDRSMFGSLSDVFKSGFFDTENADIIYIFDTNNNLLKYQIFSYYIINSEEYYITTYFGSDDSFQKFINTIKSRSYSDRGIDVTVNDKILTLSTCAGFEGTSTRRVIHAKRVN